MYITHCLKNIIEKLGGTAPSSNRVTDHLSTLCNSIGVATATKLGLVKPVAKTSAMTADVGIDENGKLYAAAGGGSSLPTVTTADNGDVLGVVSGAWAKMDSPVVTLHFTIDPDAETAVCDEGYTPAQVEQMMDTKIVNAVCENTSDGQTYYAGAFMGYCDGSSIIAAGIYDLDNKFFYVIGKTNGWDSNLEP